MGEHKENGPPAGGADGPVSGDVCAGKTSQGQYSTDNTSGQLSPFPTITVPELLAHPVEVDWLIEGFGPRGATGLLIGPGDAGKTWMLLQLALAIATGGEWLEALNCQRGPVLIVDAENAIPLLQERLAQLVKGYKLAVDDLALIHFITGEAVDLSPTKSMSGELIKSESMARLWHTVEAIQPALVAFDSLTRVHTSDENSSKEMSAIFRFVKPLVDRFNCFALFTHHTNKTGGYRGSTDIINFVDSAFQVEPETGQLAVRHVKSRWGASLDCFTIRLSVDNEAGTAVLNNRGGAEPIGRRIQAWLRGKLAGGEKGRQALLTLASEEKLCGQRELDAALKWGVVQGKLRKRQEGRQVVYALLDDGEIPPEVRGENEHWALDL